MIVTLHTTHTCLLCGHHEHGLRVHNVRINKHTLRTVGPGPGISCHPPNCRECGHHLADRPDHHTLDPEDAARIDTARARKGWTPLRTAS